MIHLGYVALGPDALPEDSEEDRWQPVGGGMLTVHPVEQWVPRAHRRAYLAGAAAVLGYQPMIMT
jgi:hypothetical protein